MKFSTFCFSTICAIYLLIFVGGVVRSTGAGMGCPDWPKCFGLWIPPTSVEQLPENYQEIFGEKLKGEVVFNATKTWIEYLNRLLGVVIGFFVLGTFLFSFYRKTSIKTRYLTFLGLCLTLLQGWLGSKVVATELSHSMINVHLGLAIIIVLVYVYCYAIQENTMKLENSFPKLLMMLVLCLTVVQMFFGTEVRTAVDTLSKKLEGAFRATWLETIGIKFYIHRSFSLFVLFINYLLFRVVRNGFSDLVKKKLTYSVLTILGLEVVTGVILYYIGFPAFAQPIHLLFATLLLGVQFYILCLSTLQTKVI
jgi:heme a synthase